MGGLGEWLWRVWGVPTKRKHFSGGGLGISLLACVRGRSKIQRFDNERMRHIPADQHENSDGLSRAYCPSHRFELWSGIASRASGHRDHQLLSQPLLLRDNPRTVGN